MLIVWKFVIYIEEKRGSFVKISGLLITKNNGRSLDWALASVVDYLDELIIVDDYSTDNTLEIAAKYGAKIYINAFEDFSSQRNFGISKCTGDWIYTMDADEVMGENIHEAFNYLKTTKYRAFLFSRYNLVDLDPCVIINSPHHYSEWQVRMFINDGKCYYENPVHHQLQNCRPRLKIPNINIFHFHFLMHDYETRKKRTAYYESVAEGSGFPACYLFEDYPHTYLRGIEKINPVLLTRIKQEMMRVPYSYQISELEQKKFDYAVCIKTAIAKLRYQIGL